MQLKLMPAIVIVTFNRAKSLERLLGSLNNANYLAGQAIPLVISVDYQDSEAHLAVLASAEAFEWKFGEKRIIKHEKNLGLRKHVLSCGDLTKTYGSIIMLEDDIFVSPYFYNYSAYALSFYQDSEEIGGISLYNHRRNFQVGLPFAIVPDSNDVFFLQIASSWGQAWTEKQWSAFRSWYDDENKIDNSAHLPRAIRNWPPSSWLKEFIKYLIAVDKYFVYPNKSLSTNFGDSGTHNKQNNVEYQVPLYIGDDFRFIKLKDSFNVYDAFFEMLPVAAKKIAPHLNEFDLTIDLYGTKELKNIKTNQLLSSKVLKHQTAKYGSFGMELKPVLLNVVNKIGGKTLSLSNTEDFLENNLFDSKSPRIFYYFYTQVPLKSLVTLLVRKIKLKINE